MGFENRIFPITKLETDDNISYSYFRSFITFYNYIITLIRHRYMEKNKIDLFNVSKNNKKYIKELFKLCYNNTKHFDFFYQKFFEERDILIFTYFNNLPVQFMPYPKELYYYYPLINFHGNNKFFKKDIIKFDDVFNNNIKKDKYINTENNIQTTIPLKNFKNFKLPDKYFLMLKIKNYYLIANNITFLKNNKIKINNVYSKQGKHFKYKKYEQSIYNFKDIEFISVLLPITKKNIDNIFEIDEIKKDAIFYNIRVNKEQEFDTVRFYTFYPKGIYINLEEQDYIPYCMRVKNTKNIKAININIDTFHNNKIIEEKYKDKKFNYLDYRDNKYEKKINSKIFRCINSEKELKKRYDICNLKVISRRKKYLFLIIYKNFYTARFLYNYLDFLKEFDVKFLINTYGDRREENKFADMTELVIIDKKEIKNFKKIDVNKGTCEDLFKKGKLIKKIN